MGGGVEQAGSGESARKKKTEHAVSTVISQSGGSSGAFVLGCTEIEGVGGSGGM